MPIKAVVSYTNKGTLGVCGQTVGADGSGNYAILFDSDTPEEAEEAARNYIKRLTDYYGSRLTNIFMVVGYEGFCGNFLQTIKVPPIKKDLT